jgi:FtsZ-interacting cell division protein ZipA
MDTGTIVAIVIGALVLIAIAVLATRAARDRKLETRRNEAGELRQEAMQRDLTAQRHSAAAEEKAALADQAEAEARQQAAVAQRERAEAEERSAVADREGRLAREHQERAYEIDPDADATDADTDDRWARNEQSSDARTERR